MMDLKHPILLGPVQNQEHYMNGVIARRNNFCEPIHDFLREAFDDFAELTGRRYDFLTEYACEDAEVVFFTMGSAAENIEAAIDWLAEQGGLEAMAGRNRRKAETLYDAIGASNFYANPVAEHCRSWMNVPFTLADPGLDGAFLAEAKAAGLNGLKGHRSVGGMRASIYNAMPQEGVEALVDGVRGVEVLGSRH